MWVRGPLVPLINHQYNMFAEDPVIQQKYEELEKQLNHPPLMDELIESGIYDLMMDKIMKDYENDFTKIKGKGLDIRI